jgi:hypothetical protein
MQPHARLDELDYVSILMFESPALDFADDDKTMKSRDQPQRRSALGRPAITTDVP